jgi:HK97 family phage portal protein
MGFIKNQLKAVASFFQNNQTSNTNGQIMSGRKDLIKQAMIAQYSGNKNPDVDLKKAGEQISSVFSCIKILSEAVNRLSLTIYKYEGVKKIPLTSHAYFDQLKYNPQQWVNTKDWLTGIIYSLYTEGNAYAFIDEATGQFKLLDPHQIEIGFYQNQLWYYSDFLKIPFRPEEILHFRLIVKDVIGKGLNPIEALRLELNIKYKAESTVSNFYTNETRGTKYLSQIADMGKTTNQKLAEIVEDWNAKYSGHDNSGNLIIVPPNFQLNELKLNSADANFLTTAAYSENAIFGLFGVPKYLQGQNDSTQKYEEASMHFRINTLGALLNLITAELEFKLLTPKERSSGVTIEFNQNILASTNIVDKANALRTLFQMAAVTPNEVRTAFNIPVLSDEYSNYTWLQKQNAPLQLYDKYNLLPPVKGSDNTDNNNTDNNNTDQQ